MTSTLATFLTANVPRICPKAALTVKLGMKGTDLATMPGMHHAHWVEMKVQKLIRNEQILSQLLAFF